MSQYKIMSFNMRTQAKGDGINQFLCRRDFIAEFLGEVKPDVIGCQEIQPIMYDALIESLPDYYIVGCGRGANYDDEAVCIAFRKDRFNLCECETFWLSPTPDTPGSRYTGDQSVCPRICTWVTLKPKDGEPFRVYNVHTDHIGVTARILAANQVLQKLDANNKRAHMRSFITGDFNAEPDDLCIKTMLGYPAGGLVDLTADSGLTFHGFGKRFDDNIKIDYIFADADVKPLRLDVFKQERGGVWLSDHYPIMATVEI